MKQKADGTKNILEKAEIKSSGGMDIGKTCEQRQRKQKLENAERGTMKLIF